MEDSGPRYGILVNSCDAYADCWEPFFKLLSTYWPERRTGIVLNTETAGYEFPGLEIECPRVELETGRRLTWTERLLETLKRAPYDVVLYMQEDYFLKASVDARFLDYLVGLMLEREWTHVSLERNPELPEGGALEEEFLSEIPQRADWRLNTQAGLWKRDRISTYARRHESVWEFEWYGTRRAWRRSDSFYHVNQAYRDAHGGLNPLPYDGTGIVHGHWDRAVVTDLFERHGIEVDFSERGFFDEHGAPRAPAPLIKRVVRRARSYW
jgi:hypothetical protein